jgi:2-keto-4-pentenoate hydratase
MQRSSPNEDDSSGSRKRIGELSGQSWNDPMGQVDDLAEAFLQIHLSKGLASHRNFDPTILSIDDAYEVQRRVITTRVARGDEIVGYKVGCTSTAIRHQFGLTEPICGRVMAPHVFHGNTVLNWHDYVCCAVEPEFVLILGKNLVNEVEDERELAEAIEWVSPGIEAHNYKFWFGKPTLQELIASNGIHAGLVVGTERVRPVGLDWEAECVCLFRNGELAASGIGAEIMGGPLRSLRWLANHLIQRGEHLKAGQIIIPGSAVELVAVGPGDRMAARFTHIGCVEAEFRA